MTTDTATEVRERHILFSAPMVRAILAGTKTRTRRVVPFKRFPEYTALTRPSWAGPGVTVWMDLANPTGAVCRRVCPYGVPSNRLWVRESVWSYELLSAGRNRQFRWPKFSNEDKARRWFDKSCDYTADWKHGWTPPGGDGGSLNKMFMPRWASRITLEITDVRVERIQDISPDDCLAEGVWSGRDIRCNSAGLIDTTGITEDFRILWDSINAKRGYSWESNPWVWAVSFRRIK